METRKIRFREAIREAMSEEMRLDSTVFCSHEWRETYRRVYDLELRHFGF